MPNLSDNIADRLNIQQVNFLRAAAGQEKEVLQMLEALEKELIATLGNVLGKTDFTVGRLKELLKQTQADITAAYGGIAVANEQGLVDIATVAAKSTIDAIQAEIGADVLSVAWSAEQIASIATNTVIQGSFAADWWGQQGDRLQGRFEQEMRMGQLRGETNDQLAARVRGTKAMGYRDGIMEASRQQAQTLVRTSALGVANAARLDTYAHNDDVISGVQWMSTLDERTCEECMALDGCAWSYPGGDGDGDYADYEPDGHDKEFEPAPLHFGCRCVIIPTTYSWKELADSHGNSKAAQIADEIPDDMRASMDGEVAAATTFDEWLGAKEVTFQDDVLGPARAEAWRAGDLKLSGLTDQSHNPLTLEQLGLTEAKSALAQMAEKEVAAPAPLPAPAAPPPKPLTFERSDAARKWADDGVLMQQLKELSKTQSDILYEYQTGEYHDANKWLRSKVSNAQWEIYGKQITKLDNVLKDAETLPETLSLFRGLPSSIVDRLKIGDIITDNGFVSTSLSKQSALDFSRGGILEIVAPKGAKGIYLDDLSGEHGHEIEILLGRGSRFRVVEIRTEKRYSFSTNTVTYVKVELLPPE